MLLRLSAARAVIGQFLTDVLDCAVEHAANDKHGPDQREQDAARFAASGAQMSQPYRLAFPSRPRLDLEPLPTDAGVADHVWSLEDVAKLTD